MAVSIGSLQRKLTLNTVLIRKFVTAILLEEDKKRESVSIVYVEDGYMKGLNRAFRNTDRTTDVLAFDLAVEVRHEKGKTFYDDTLGEVYVCADRAISQAKEYGVDISEEIGRLTAHGVLHLLGYRDGTQAEKKVMRKQEDRFLEELEELVSGMARRKKGK